MELTYPFIIYIGILVIILLLILKPKKQSLYKDGKKIANTKYIMNAPYYKDIMKKYKILSYIITGAFMSSIFCGIVLLSRPAIVDTNSSPLYSRDIFLCLDVSSSVDKLNQELVGELKKTVNNLKGERFGISIFNTSSVLLVPLTDDYDYILSVLDTLGESFQAATSFSSGTENYRYLLSYINDGTLVR